MQTNQQLHFLQQKIQELGSAICYNQSDSVLKFPTCLVTSIKVDDYGYVWFRVPRPKQCLREFENGFPVRLDFYRKGKTYFLQVTGKAWMVTDPEEMMDLPARELDPGVLSADLVVVKVKMMRADYHETATAQRQSWWLNPVYSLVSWLRHSSGGYVSSDTYFPAS